MLHLSHGIMVRSVAVTDTIIAALRFNAMDSSAPSRIYSRLQGRISVKCTGTLAFEDIRKRKITEQQRQRVHAPFHERITWRLAC